MKLNRVLFASILSVMFALGLPTLGLLATTTSSAANPILTTLAFLPVPVQSGDSIGSIPAAVSSPTMRSEWTCSCHNMKQAVETKHETGTSLQAQAKAHDAAVEALAQIHPPIAPALGSSASNGSRLSSGGVLTTYWRTPMMGSFIKTGVVSYPEHGVPASTLKLWHQQAVVALAVEMPAI